MKRPFAAALLLALALSASGCGTFNKLTGATDDTVLPGNREDAIPGKSQFPDPSDTAGVEQPGGQPVVADQEPGGEAAPASTDKPPCKAGDPDCSPEQGDVFTDPQ